MASTTVRSTALKRLERVGGSYYLPEDDGSKTGPVCPQCYGADEIVCILHRSRSGARCARCGTRYAGVEASVDGPGRSII